MKKISRSEWTKDIKCFLEMDIQNARSVSFYVFNGLYIGMGTKQMVIKKAIEYLSFIEKFNPLCFSETIDGIRELKQKAEEEDIREKAKVVQFPSTR